MGERITLKRHIYTHSEIETEYRKGTPAEPSCGDIIKSKCKCSKKKAWKTTTTYLPILKFLVQYDFKRYFINDFLAGLNVSFMNLPQGMGFGVLAGLQPVYGLYTSFFPILFYLLLGTSPHISFGTNAVLAILTQNVVDREVMRYRSNLPHTTTMTTSSYLNTTTMSPLNLTDEKINNVFNFSMLSSNFSSTLKTMESNSSAFNGNAGTNFTSVENASVFGHTNNHTLTTVFPPITYGNLSSVLFNTSVSPSRNSENFSTAFSNSTPSLKEDFQEDRFNRIVDILGNISTTEMNENSSWITESMSTLFSASTDEEILKVKVGAAMTCSLLVGMILGGMGLLHLGFLTTYLSVSFIGGFTTAAAVHIASSQVPKALGIVVGSHSGAGRLIKMYIDLFTNISQIKVSEVIIALVCMTVLLAVKILNERFKKQMKIPIPIDLLVVIIGTIASRFGKFEDNFDVVVVGDIPSGIPMPKVPSLDRAYDIVSDCVVMAVLSFAMSISMAKLTAGMNGIKINDNQELLAYGVCNIGSSFFSCFPQATAPPRTMILNSMGSKTTLNAVPTAIFMLLVLYWIGQLFASLPMSVLAAMIIVSMKGLLVQFRDIPRYWRINKFDGMIWLITWTVSVFADLDYGVIIGIGVSIFFVVVQNQLANGRLLGQSETEDIIIDVKYRNRILEYPGVKIFQFEAPLYFANAERFQSQLHRLIVNPLKIKKAQRLYGPVIKIEVPGEEMKKAKLNGKAKKCEINDAGRTFSHRRNYLMKLKREVPHHIILDCQMMSYIDSAGVNMLQRIIKDYKDIDVQIFLAKCPKRMLTVLESAEFFNRFPKEHVFFDVVDAVETTISIEAEKELNKTPEDRENDSRAIVNPVYSVEKDLKYSNGKEPISAVDDESTKL